MMPWPFGPAWDCGCARATGARARRDAGRRSPVKTNVSLTPTDLYELADDAGFLGLLDPDAYAAYVGRDWTLPRLLPEPHDRVLLLAVPAGAYRCAVVQLHDPEADRPDEFYLQPNADFVVVLTRDDGAQTPWSDFPWAVL